jgi:hypothetical protein
MEFSGYKNSNGGGQELLNEVASLTGLSEHLHEVQAELTNIIQTSGHTPQNLTLEELRASMVAYLESLQKDFEAQELLEAEHTTGSNAALCGRTFCFE